MFAECVGCSFSLSLSPCQPLNRAAAQLGSTDKAKCWPNPEICFENEGPFDMPNDSRITVHSGRCICMLLFWLDFGFGTEWPKILQTYACMSSGLADKQSSKWVYGNSLVQLCKWCYFKALEIQVSSLAKSLIESISHSHSHAFPQWARLISMLEVFVILSDALDARN